MRARHPRHVIGATEGRERAGERVVGGGRVAAAQRGDAEDRLGVPELEVFIRGTQDAEGGAGVAAAALVAPERHVPGGDAGGNRPQDHRVAQGVRHHARLGQALERLGEAFLAIVALRELEEQARASRAVVGRNGGERCGIVVTRRTVLVGRLTEIAELLLPKRRVCTACTRPRGIVRGGRFRHCSLLSLTGDRLNVDSVRHVRGTPGSTGIPHGTVN